MLVVLALVAAVLHFTNFRDYVFEDAYITYRYADNLATGQGFAFNPGDRVLGTSTPLYTLLLAALRFLGCDLPTSAALLFSLALSLVALAGAAILRRFGHPNIAVVYALLILWGCGARLRFFGMETMLHSLLLLVVVMAALDRREILTGVLLGLAFLVRYDAFMMVATLFVLLWIANRRIPWRVYAAAAAVVLPWLVFAQVYFGSVFPNTLGAKTRAETIPDYLYESLGRLSEAFFSPLFRFASEADVPRIVTAILLLALVAPIFSQTALATRRAALLLSLLIVPTLFWLGYSLIGPPLEHRWYLVPALDLFLVFCGLTWGGATARWRRRSRPTALTLALLFAAGIFLPFGVAAEREHWIDNPVYARRVEAYRELAPWIVRNGLDDLLLMTPEPGFLAYHTHNPVIDLAGLVTENELGDERPNRDMKELLEEQRPDLVISHSRALDSLGRDWIDLYHTLSKSLYIRRDVFRERLPRLAEDWLVPRVVRGGEIGHPLHWDFEENVEGFEGVGTREGFFGKPRDLESSDGEPAGRYLHSRGRRIFNAVMTPPFALDFDVLRFDFFADGKQATSVQLLVDGLVVLEVDGWDQQGQTMREVVWPVRSWRGRMARLRLYDDHPKAWVAIDRVRSERGEGVVKIEDFESGEWSDLWRLKPASAPCRFAEIARQYGLATILGNATASTLCAEDGSERKLVSHPFKIERDRLDFTALDFGQGAIDLKIDGKIVRRFQASGAGHLEAIVWEVDKWRGREAVLALIDESPRRAGVVRGLGIDDIFFYDPPSEPTADSP